MKPIRDSHLRHGRPTKFQPARVRRLLALVEDGLPLAKAAAAVNICRDTLHTWTQRDPTFSDAIASARAKGLARLLSHVQRHAVKDGRLALSLLARLAPEDFAEHRTAAVEVAGPAAGGALIVELSDEEMRLYEERNELPVRYARDARTARTLVVLPQEDGQAKRDEEDAARARERLLAAEPHEDVTRDDSGRAAKNRDGPQG